MATSTTATRAEGRRLLTGLERLTLYALIGFALALVYMQAAMFRSLVPPIGIVQLVPTLVVMAPFAVRWRWAALLGALWMILVVLWASPFIVKDLAHPAEDLHAFLWTLIVLPLLLAGIAVGIAATVQNRRRAR